MTIPSVQYWLNGACAGGGYALVAVGFSLVLDVGGFFNLAHGVAYSVGAYAVYSFARMLELPWWTAVGLALSCAALFGVAVETVVYRTMRRRRSSSLALLLASLGIFVAMQSVLAFGFGDDMKSVGKTLGTLIVAVGNARVTVAQLLTFGLAVVVFAGLEWVLRTTEFGRAVRAMSEEPFLAEVVGVDTGRILLVCFAVGSAIAGLAGVLAAYDTGLTPGMGFPPLLMAVVVVVLTAGRSPTFLLLGSTSVGVLEHVLASQVPLQWVHVCLFVALLVLLVRRRRGLRTTRIERWS